MAKRNKINIDQLAATFEEDMQDYLKFADGSLAEAIEETAQQIEDDIKSVAPRNTGEYASSWTHENRTVGKASKKQTVVFANAPGYRRAHLLEHGHAIANHSMHSSARVPARVHIKPAEEKGEQMLVDKIKEKLSS